MKHDDELPRDDEREPMLVDFSDERPARWWEAWLTLAATFIVAAVAFYLASLGN